MTRLQAAITAVRNLRGEYAVPPSRRAPVTVSSPDPAARAALERHAGDVARLAWASELRVVETPPREDGVVSQVVGGGLEVAVRLADLVDVGRERARLDEELERARSLLAGTRARLENEAFVERAPEDVVGREREKAADLERSIERLRGLRDALGPV